MRDSDGVMQEDLDCVSNIVVDFYMKLFRKAVPREVSDLSVFGGKKIDCGD